MVVIKKFEVKNLLGNGVSISFDTNKKNLVIAKEKYGKTLLINLMVATVGSSKEKAIGLNGIKNVVNTKLECEIGGSSFEICATISPEAEDPTNYVVKNIETNEQENCISSEELTDFIFKAIKYPRYVTWDGRGRKTMLEDCIAPYFMDQDWRGGIGQSINLKYKPANRVAVSLAFDSPKFSEKLNAFYQNDELIAGMINYFRLNSSKNAIISVLRDSVIDDEVGIGSNFEKKIKLENELNHYKELIAGVLKEYKDEIYFKRNIDVINKLILPSLSEKVGKENAETALAELQNLWLTTLKDVKQNKKYLSYVSKVKEIRKDLVSIENELAKSAPNFSITQKYFDHIKANIKNTSSEYSPEEISKFENLKDTWDDLYSEIRSSYLQEIQSNYDYGKLNIKGFGIESSTQGTNKFEYIKYTLVYLKKYIGENVFYIWDSIYQNDENSSRLAEEERRLKIITDMPVNGIFTSSFYSEEVSNSLIENSDSKIKIIKINESNIFEKFAKYE